LSCRWRCDRKRDISTSGVIRVDKTNPDFRYCRSSSSTRRLDDHEAHKENRPPRRHHIGDDIIQPYFRSRDVDRNRKWSAMKRTSTARSSLQSCTARLLPEISDIRPDVDEAGSLFVDDYSTCDIDDVFSETESQLGTTYLPNSK